ncbi:hypothetical protein LINGRAHAP2_LOCUS5581 [Linum grandiflorum]
MHYHSCRNEWGYRRHGTSLETWGLTFRGPTGFIGSNLSIPSRRVL